MAYRYLQPARAGAARRAHRYLDFATVGHDTGTACACGDVIAHRQQHGHQPPDQRDRARHHRCGQRHGKTVGCAQRDPAIGLRCGGVQMVEHDARRLRHAIGGHGTHGRGNRLDHALRQFSVHARILFGAHHAQSWLVFAARGGAIGISRKGHNTLTDSAAKPGPLSHTRSALSHKRNRAAVSLQKCACPRVFCGGFATGFRQTGACIARQRRPNWQSPWHGPGR